MKNFLRALRMAGQYWPALGCAMLCSICVATLWGANIAALFPILEVTLQGKSLQTWNVQRMEQAKVTVQNINRASKHWMLKLRRLPRTNWMV